MDGEVAIARDTRTGGLVMMRRAGFRSDMMIIEREIEWKKRYPLGHTLKPYDVFNNGTELWVHILLTE